MRGAKFRSSGRMVNSFSSLFYQNSTSRESRNGASGPIRDNSYFLKARREVAGPVRLPSGPFSWITCEMAISQQLR